MNHATRSTIITICLGISALIILDSLNAGQALVMFLFAGVIPGTNVAISGAQMLEFFVLLIGFTLSRITLNAIRHTSKRARLA